jgi:hypothetical protein
LLDSTDRFDDFACTGKLIAIPPDRHRGYVQEVCQIVIRSRSMAFQVSEDKSCPVFKAH